MRGLGCKCPTRSLEHNSIACKHNTTTSPIVTYRVHYIRHNSKISSSRLEWPDKTKRSCSVKSSLRCLAGRAPPRYAQAVPYHPTQPSLTIEPHRPSSIPSNRRSATSRWSHLRVNSSSRVPHHLAVFFISGKPTPPGFRRLHDASRVESPRRAQCAC